MRPYAHGKVACVWYLTHTFHAAYIRIWEATATALRGMEGEETRLLS